ncbi:tumor necrosis factor ligand superfamily member 10-like [Glandiceps talaboti]
MIHLTGKPEGFTSNKAIRRERGKFKVGPWESTAGKAFRRHINVDNYHMIVPKSGMYHIYSQAYFRDESENAELQLREYLHYTVLESTAYAPDPITLMKSGRTQEGQEYSNYYYTSFHSGLFELREGDKIYMKVYLPSEDVKLDAHQESTFMGMYLVSDVDD